MAAANKNLFALLDENGEADAAPVVKKEEPKKARTQLWTACACRTPARCSGAPCCSKWCNTNAKILRDHVNKPHAVAQD